MIRSSDHPIIRSSDFLRRNSVFLLTLLALGALFLSYLYLTAGGVPLSVKPKHVWTILSLNLILLMLPITIIAARIFTLWRGLRASASDSRLQNRIVILFSVVAIVPTIIVSVFSAIFFNIGIQTWFNDRVQTAVQESLAVAEAYMAEHKENLRGDALAMAGDLNQEAGLAITNPPEFNRIVAAQAAVRLLTEAVVFQRDRIIAEGRLSFALAFERIPKADMERAARGEVVIMTAENDKVQALVKLDALPDGYLLVGRLVDSKVLAHMRSAQGAVHEYDNLKTQLDRLQAVFSIVFVTLAVLLLVSAIGYGMVFASRLTKPVSELAQAAERVRSGDFSARVAESDSHDEIGMLARAFNRMTEQLKAQRADLIEANRRIDERRRFSDSVLSGVSAGVIALDRNKRITLFNPSSISILSEIGQPITAGDEIATLLPGIEEPLTQAEHLAGDVAQSTLTLNKDGKTITLHVRVTVEKFGSEVEGFIVTFDDITLLVSAQRTAAWADVARRVAHEIKNPLTPIHLAAERLKRKYAKQAGDDEENFVKYTDTIVKHAGDIGRMVEEFVSFARLPTPVFANEDMGTILKKSLFSTQVSNADFDCQLDAPDSPVMFYCDERQISQVMANLLKNAAESVEARLARQPQGENGRIVVRLRAEGEELKVIIEDNGVGFPADTQKMLEPYVTTRAKGTGLGLAIVKKIVEDHKGVISLENINGSGARVTLSFPQHCDI